MTARQALKLLVPPVFPALWRSLWRARAAEDAQPPEWQYVPEGWAYADAHPEVRGWNVQGVLDAYKRKWPRFVALTRGTRPWGVAHEGDLCLLDDSFTQRDVLSHNTVLAFAYGLALASRGSEVVSMLDWGGGIGHYCLLAEAALPGVQVDYHCKDVPLLVQFGQEVLPGRHFTSDESCLERTYDFVLASASLYYSRDWRAVLRRLATATCGYLLVTRLPTVVSVPSFVMLQRAYAYGYGTEYLGWCLNRGEVLEALRDAGMELVREFILGEQIELTGVSETCRLRGFLCVPKTQRTR